MHIIKTFGDINNLKVSKQISKPLAEHLERKLERLRQTLAAETDRNDFSLTAHGSIGVLQKGEQTLTGIGLSESYAEIMPEWVSQLKLDKEVYYVLYFIAFRQVIKNADTKEICQLMRALIDKVIVDENRKVKEIEFKFPLPTQDGEAMVLRLPLQVGNG